MMLWRLMLREMRRRPGRATLTLLSIAIGMGAIVSVSLGTATTREAYRQMYDEVSGRSALQVTAEGGGTFAADLTATVEEVPGVAAAVPTVQRRTVLFSGEKRFDLLMMGIDPALETKARDYELREGRLLRDSGDSGALLEAGFADGAGIRVGDEVRLMTPRGTPLLKRVTVVGLLAPRGAAGFNKGGVVFLPLRQAQRYFTKLGQVNCLDLVLRPGADERTVTEEVKARIPAGLDVHPSATRTQLAKETLLEIEQGLYLASGFAIVLAVIIIVNTFLMNVSERRGQLAVLRAVGATRRQIMGMLLAEGVVLGILGAGLGCLLGLGGGYLLMGAITRIFVATPPPVVFTPLSFVLAAALGPVLGMLAAVIPAYLTTKISPLEAMQPMVAQDGAHVPIWLTIAGVLLEVASGVLLVASVHGLLPTGLAVAFGIGFVAMIVLLFPVMVRPLSGLVAWLLTPVLRLEGRLAHRQVRRRPVRTALTIGVLYMAVAMGIGLGTTIINSVDSVRAWYRRILVGDFFLRAAFPDTATGQAVELPASLGDEIRKIPGVTTLDTIRFFNARAGGRAVFVVAREFTEPDLPLDLYGGDADEVRQQLQAGEVVVGTVLAQQAGVKVGDDITIESRKGTQQLRVAGLAVDYMVGGYILYMHRQVAERLFNVEGVSAFLIEAEPAARPEVQAALAKVAQKYNLMLHSFADLSVMLDRMMAGVIGSLWGILVLGFVVAAFGIANTLTMNVLEQTRELAMLRVVAMTRGQVRKMVLSQAGIIGIIGLALGLVFGLTSAYAINLSMMPLLGYPVQFTLYPWLLLGSSAVGMVLVLAAAYFPARRAARLDLLIALQYE